MSNSFQANFQFGTTNSAKPLEPEDPMRILILGDFSGHGDKKPIEQRKLHRVDVDNFDELIEKLQPVAAVGVGEDPESVIRIPIRSLDDFHPDTLYEEVSIFGEMRDLRDRLLNPKTFSDAAARLNETLARRVEIESDGAASAEASSGEPSSETSQAKAAEDASGGSSAGGLLESALGQSAETVDTSVARSSPIDIQGLVNEIVAPYIEPAPDPRQGEYVGYTEAAIAGQMRAILHDESFQNLEAVWRGLSFLVSRVTTSLKVQVFVWDVTKEELLEASEAESDQLELSVLFQKLVTDREQIPFSLIVGDQSFGNDLNDLILLSRLGAIGASSGGPFLGGAAPSLLDLDSWIAASNALPIEVNASDRSVEQANWQSLRESPMAPWIGLSAPRFLLRLPYGSSTQSVDVFPFEEIDDPVADHECLLWGTASVFVATTLAQAYLKSGWEMKPGDASQVDDLPALTYDDDGEVQLKACGESFLAERVLESMKEHGLIPLMSFKDRSRVGVVGYQSIAKPAKGLAGAWS